MQSNGEEVSTRSVDMDYNEFIRGEVFRRLTTCPAIEGRFGNAIGGYPHPWCVRYPMCEKGCCATCTDKCPHRCLRVTMKEGKR